MSQMFIPCLIGSLTRRLSQVARNAALGSSASAQRYISNITSSALPFNTVGNPVFKPQAMFLSPLFGRCQQLLSLQPSNGMKTKSALKKRCKDCFIVRRRGKLFVFCKTHPRHKQRQG